MVESRFTGAFFCSLSVYTDALWKYPLDKPHDAASIVRFYVLKFQSRIGGCIPKKG